MNVDNTSNSNTLSSCEVTSKYFSGKSGMDDSLSDFQEKKNFKSAKETQKIHKASTSKTKPKKNIKRIRGQKDIRAVVKSKNELIAYSNDFDKICKQSGIDVDSEQLQLAIALSKSLQQPAAALEQVYSSSSSAQERTGKIRTTLQEYGFVVPKIKVVAKKGKKIKKYRKNYKLIQTTESEKQQIISDRYSQVLFQNLHHSKETVNVDCNSDISNSLFNLATNIAYEYIKDNSLLYVENLLESIPSYVGCLLKDWAEIPGRPISPACIVPDIKFERVDCTREELDIVLSGSIKAAKEIVETKHSSLTLDDQVNNNFKSKNGVHENTVKNLKMDVECIEIEEHAVDDTNYFKHNKEQRYYNPTDVINVEDSNLFAVTQNMRSCSPDIFDDDVSEVMDNCNPNTAILSQRLPSQSIKNPCDILDLTECVKVHSQTAIEKYVPQLLQGSIINKRNTSDFMDITECVVGSSQPIREKIIEENIDLTQNCENNITIITESTPNKNYLSMDLTQSSDSNTDLPLVQISGKDSMDDTIILNEDFYSSHNIGKDVLHSNSDKHSDASFQVNNSHNEGRSNWTEKSLKNSNVIVYDEDPINVGSKDVEDYPILVSNESSKERVVSPMECISFKNNLELDIVNSATTREYGAEYSTVDLTEENIKSPKQSDEENSKSKTISFFEEFVHSHSESSSKEKSDVIVSIEETSNTSMTINSDSNKTELQDIDLTQTTDSSSNTTTKVNSSKITFDTINLGKVGDVSIDYDEIFDDMVRSHASSPSKSINTSSRCLKTDFSNENDEKPSKIDLKSNSSQNLEAFEISDNEFHNSILRSRLDLNNPKPNFDFGGISVVDNLPDLPSFRPSTDNVENRTMMSDSYLPVVNIRDNNIVSEKETKSCSTISATPCSIGSKHIIAKTPKNGEYIIKTDQVTPMLNYEGMTTPERNAELDKYGLKPFKRKRAIQLLTHLYLQTHPIVESLENIPSPSKRFKPTDPDISCRISLTKSPKKNSGTVISRNQSKYPIKNATEKDDNIENVDKENDIYDVTSEVPDIRDIECLEEDLVFQKREKAKVHGCRVPLHIAFHNYVHARQRLWEAILRYEPVNIDVIYKGLVADGYRYDPKDLLKFMDKKCITVKTVDNNGKNKKHY